MLSPKFSGFDSENRPYTIEALTAVQDREDPNLIRLTSINGHMVVSESDQATKDVITDVELNASGGLLRTEQQTMQLEGNIKLRSNNDYEFNTQLVFIEFETNRIYGTDPVQVSGPRGSIEAEEFEVTENGDRLFFGGGVNTTLIMAKDAED